ncbi:ABC transporter ATP-binding protein [Anaerocolumna sp. MB42-C2]|uniref:ABC transporter ATP-binding protein n=1 Tax=Anaerocolumna sp. MB42-C2 TaxID=3070997 RepID=UPI0027DFC934|nr:ABC transporter ATP-binding protein [Anaerocolumna sp. MB42-C2]WMJ87600.1 ABC transporter ATP-binding protein [Anaerocolumna sp. MB42-C2]
MVNEELLKISNLVTSFRINGKYYAAVDGVSLTVNHNEVFAIVGESGCGKSALALSIMNLHNKDNTKIEGNIYFKNKDLLSLSLEELNSIRGRDIGMIFQDPLTALNPLMKIGAQIEESLSFHLPLNKAEKQKRAMELLEGVGIQSPALTYDQFPHELSGGMRQRAMIAIALACKPSLVIADEPTTALDVTIQAQILDLLKKLQSEIKSGIILITHDLGVVAEMADKVAVMYAGQIVETAEVGELFAHPQHPYTRSLLASVPSMASGDEKEDRLHVIQGMVPSLLNLKREGCRFSPRVPWIKSSAHEEKPVYHEVRPGHFVLCSCYKEFKFNKGKEM